MLITATAVVLSPGVASATYPPPDGPTVSTVSTTPVVVRVPVDDRQTELVQMALAATTGGGLVFAATRRRRFLRSSG
jgi:hypothetical protein